MIQCKPSNTSDLQTGSNLKFKTKSIPKVQQMQSLEAFQTPTPITKRENVTETWHNIKFNLYREYYYR